MGVAERGSVNTLGMFDFVKGIFLLLIIIGHSTTDYFHYWEYDFQTNIPVALLGSVFSVFVYGLVPMFFMICGYGFRKTSIKKGVKNQFKYFWKPYMIVIFITGVAVIAKKLIIPGDVLEGLRYQVLPYLFVFCPGERKLWGLYMDSVGPIWFFWVFAMAGILLNIVLQEKQFWIQCMLIGVLGCLGVEMRDITLPYCIQQIMVCCGYMYIGWLMKKLRFFEREYPVWLAVLTMLFCVLHILNGGGIEISQNEYTKGAGEVIVSYVVGILFMHKTSKLNYSDGPIIDKISWLGKNALYICCIHTVAYTVVPWERLAELLSNVKLIGILAEFFIHLIIAVGGCFFILECQKAKRVYVRRKNKT